MGENTGPVAEGFGQGEIAGRLSFQLCGHVNHRAQVAAEFYRCDSEAAQSEARIENSGTSRGARVTTFSGFAAGITIRGMRRYSSRRCLPAARRSAVPMSSARAGTRRTMASVDLSA